MLVWRVSWTVLLLVVLRVLLSAVCASHILASSAPPANASSADLHATRIGGGPQKRPVELPSIFQDTMKAEALGIGSDSGRSVWNSSRIMNDQPQLETLPKGKGSGRSGSKNHKKKGEVAKETSLDSDGSTFWSEDIQVGCKELRARRYISDGFCTSEEPIKEVACAGYCLPIMDMPWYTEFIKTVAKTKLKDWQCVEDMVRKKRVKLLCQDGSSRSYKVKVVESCKCKKMSNSHNRAPQKRKKRRRKENQSSS